MPGKTMQPIDIKNVFEEIPGPAEEEFFEKLAGAGSVQVERNVSN
jgi:hypothetical protein